jgi:hypothetical protein
MKRYILGLTLVLAGCSNGKISDGSLEITSQEQQDYIFGANFNGGIND